MRSQTIATAPHLGSLQQVVNNTASPTLIVGRAFPVHILSGGNSFSAETIRRPNPPAIRQRKRK